MPKPRFSLKAMLIAVAISSVLCAAGHRVIFGTLADRHAAAEVAKQVVEDSIQWQRFEVERISLVSLSPRTYRVQGIADSSTVVSVHVARQPDGSFGSDGLMWLGK